MAKRLILLDHALRASTPECLYEMPEHDAAILLTVRKKLQGLPTVDAVEVVRCKDCSKWMPEFGGCKEFTTERLPTGGKKVFVTKPDDFCSYGERKEG